jgi:hypothetical protein
MDFKNILNQLDEINGNDTTASTPIESTLQSTPVASKQTLTESVAVATKSSRPSLKDVFNTLIENDITLEPAKPGAMAIKSGDATIGTAHTPQAANQMKQAIEKGDITMGGEDDEMNESDEDAKKSGKKEMSDKQKKFFGKKKESVKESKSPSQIAKDKADVKRDDKAEKAGKEVAKDAKYDGRKHPGKDGKEVAKDIEYDEWKEKKLPSISRIKKMCKDGLNQTQILKLHPMCDKQKLKDMIKKCKTNLKEGVDHILKAAKHMGKSHGLCKGGYACPHEIGSEGHRAYHEGYKEGLDECMGIRNEPVLGMVDEDEGEVVDTMASYGAMGEDETYEGNAFSGALAKTAKGSDFTVGGNTYTKTTEAEDDAGTYNKYDWNASTEGDREATYEDSWTFESMDAELDSLLNEDKVEEGIEITVNSGMEDQPDKVSVNATDDEADKLIKFVKDVGLGQYGDPELDVVTPDVADVSFYGSEAPSEEPVSSHDDMLKLMGIVDMEDDAEAPGTTDYEDEEAVDSVDVQVVDGDSEEEMCEACGSKMTNEGCGCSKTDEGAQYGPDDGSHNSNNDMQGNADANASLAANDADTPQLVKEKHESEAEEDDHSDDMHEDQGYNDKEDESLGMKDGKESDKDDDEAGRRDQSKGDYGTRTNEDEHLKEMIAMLSEVGSEASEEPTQPLSQHDDDNLTTEGAEDAQADDLDGSIEPVTETQTEDQREFAVAESEEEELTEWANDAGKNGTDTSFEQDIDFMTKVISGGLNKQKSTGQTTIPVIAGQNDRTGYNGADLVKEGSVMSHDGLAGLMNRLDALSK